MRTSRRRAGISEFIAALIMIAITLVAGTAAFGWILSQAGTSEQSYGQNVAVGVNFLNERFTLVSQQFEAGGGACTTPPLLNPKCTDVNFWLYNTGHVDFTLFTIQVKNLTDPPAFPAGKSLFVNVVFNSLNFTAYDKSGARIACTNGPGWTGGAVPLPQASLSTIPFHILMPTVCPAPYGGAMYLFDGTTYTITLTGLYGNVWTETVTPNG